RSKRDWSSDVCSSDLLHLAEWYTLLYFFSSLSRAASYDLCLSLFMCVCCPQYCLSNGISALHAGALHLFNGFMLVTPHSVVRFQDRKSVVYGVCVSRC